jgi:hypothetical protein
MAIFRRRGDKASDSGRAPQGQDAADRPGDAHEPGADSRPDPNGRHVEGTWGPEGHRTHSDPDSQNAAGAAWPDGYGQLPGPQGQPAPQSWSPASYPQPPDPARHYAAQEIATGPSTAAPTSSSDPFPSAAGAQPRPVQVDAPTQAAPYVDPIPPTLVMDATAVRGADEATAATPADPQHTDHARSTPHRGHPEIEYELATTAPSIGRVMGRPIGKAKPGYQLRPAAVTLDGAAVAGFKVAAASIIGFKHESEGSVRQDAYGYTPTQQGQLVLVIADGLGSRNASQLGAAAFCEGVVMTAAHATEALHPVELMRVGEKRAKMAAQTYRLSERQVSFVGAVAVLGPQTTAIARIGDVSAFALREGGFVELFTEDTAGPLNVVTASLPSSDDSPTTAETATVPTDLLTVLVTDGLATDLRNSPALTEWLTAQWSTSRGPFAFGDTLRYRRQASHDDRTAIAAWLVPDTGSDGRVETP